MDDWVTVSEWAEKVGTLYPDLLAKANQEATAQKNDTTGLREIAARISSRLSRGLFGANVEIDATERPKKVRWLSEEAANAQIENEIEDDIEPLTRNQKEKNQYEGLSSKEKYRIDELRDIIHKINNFFSTNFELEHAKALLNRSDPGTHHPDNIQILSKFHNGKKHNQNWERFSLEEQIEYLDSIIKVQKLISKKINIDIQDDIFDLIIDRLRKVY